MSANGVFTKENLDSYLKELAKELTRTLLLNFKITIREH